MALNNLIPTKWAGGKSSPKKAMAYSGHLATCNVHAGGKCNCKKNATA